MSSNHFETLPPDAISEVLIRLHYNQIKILCKSLDVHPKYEELVRLRFQEWYKMVLVVRKYTKHPVYKDYRKIYKIFDLEMSLQQIGDSVLTFSTDHKHYNEFVSFVYEY